MIETYKLIKKAEELWGVNEYTAFFSPGRVNLIGEHTDYNGGYVFPCALTYGTSIVAAKNGREEIHFTSTNFDLSVRVSIHDIEKKLPGGAWVNYPLGVFNEFVKKGVQLEGMDILVSGDIPNGAGLSSSASLELVTAVMCNHFYQVGLDALTMAWMGKAAENDFVGVNCGILDQFAVAMGKEGHAMALKCDTMEWSYVPLQLGEYCLIISNTNKRRGLADSKYNERVAECAEAVAAIAQEKPIKLLGDIQMKEFEALEHIITDETVRKRARHVVSENQRVLDAMEALNAGNLHVFGQYMNASHDSLKDDYEVTGIELDTLVAEARKVEGVLGSRMTGAGFGGCTVSLVHKDAIDTFQKEVSKNYNSKIGLTPSFYLADIGGGASKIH